jgi:trimeric autotransporter adhesin
VGIRRFTQTGRLVRGSVAPGVMALVVVFAGGGQAGAAAGPSAQHAAEAGRVAVVGVISTAAGGVGGPGRATKVALSACGVSFAGGHLYIADDGAVRKVSAGTDALTTLAGTGAGYGPRGDDGPAASATISTCGTAVDAAGNVVIADEGHHRVRVVAASTGSFYGQAMTAGDIYTVAGGGTGGLGDGGPATSAKLNFSQCGPLLPTCLGDVTVDASGNLVIADDGHNRVRVLAASTGTFYGQAMTAGDIYTVAGGGTGGLGDGGPATSAKLSGPSGVTVDSTGNLVIGDTGHNRVRVVAASTGTFYGQAMTAGDIYTVAGNGTSGFSGDGGPATSAELSYPQGVAVDPAGNLLIADSFNDRVRVVAASTGSFYGQAMTAGDIYTVAGGGTGGLGDRGPATSATLNTPEGVTVDGAGNLVIADTGDYRVRVVPASTGTLYGRAMTAGDIYTVAGNGTEDSSGDGGPATGAELSFAEGVAVDAAGNTVIADTYNSRIRAVAAKTATAYGKNMTAGDIYTIAGNGKSGFSGDGGHATNAELRYPTGIAVDAAGNLVIADSGNNRVRVLAASTGTFYGQAMTAGDIYTVAGNGRFGFAGDGGPATSAKLSGPSGVAVDSAGNLVIADIENSRVRVVAASTGTFYGQAMTAGDIYTVAGDGEFGFAGDGGPATSAELNYPSAVAVDAGGNLVITDSYNSRVRVVAASTGTFYGQAMTAGDIYTVAGNGKLGHSGDGGPATSAELNFTQFGVQVQGGVANLAVDAAGNLVIGDTGNNRVRVVAAGTGTFYGLAMTAGDIYTVAGNGKFGFSGDGAAATGAELALPEGVAAAGGNLVIADSDNGRIRTVSG